MIDPIVFLNGSYLPLSQARISPEDRGFLFADGVYEALRYYPVNPSSDESKGGIFAVERHLERLGQSLSGIWLTGIDLTELPTVFGELIQRNDLARDHASIYLQITRGVAPRRHEFPRNAVPTIFARAQRFDPPWERWDNGVEVALVEDVRWGRCDVKSISLLANVLASEEAKAKGAVEAVFVHDGLITEGAHTSVVFVQSGRLRLHPQNERILPSVTRTLVLDLCVGMGFDVDERALAMDELSSVDEMMVLGTTTEVMPVVRVDGRPVADGAVGPLTKRIAAAYRLLHG